MKNRTRRVIRDYAITVIAAVFLALVARHFVIESYQIPNMAMKPTLMIGDTVFAWKWPYHFQKNFIPEKGDIIVYSAPSEQDPSKNLNYIRRVVGLPGDKIFVKKGWIILNDQILAVPQESDQPQLQSQEQENCSREEFPHGKIFQICRDAPIMENYGPEIVKPQSVFVLADQRTQSPIKNRNPWAMIPLSSIRGKIFTIWLSISPVSDSVKNHSWIPQFRYDRMLRRIE